MLIPTSPGSIPASPQTKKGWSIPHASTYKRKLPTMENEDEINTWYEETKDKAMKEYLKKLSLIRNQEVKIDDEEEGKQKKKKPQVKLSEKDQLIQERKLYLRFFLFLFSFLFIIYLH